MQRETYRTNREIRRQTPIKLNINRNRETLTTKEEDEKKDTYRDKNKENIQKREGE